MKITSVEFDNLKTSYLETPLSSVTIPKFSPPQQWGGAKSIEVAIIPADALKLILKDNKHLRQLMSMDIRKKVKNVKQINPVPCEEKAFDNAI